MRDTIRASGLTGHVDVFHADIPRDILLSVLAERDRRAKNIADALASAFGGRSQYEPIDLGRAVAGHIRNNGLGCYGTAAELCCAVYEASLYEGDDHYPADDADYDAWMPGAVAACETHADCSGLPHRHYVSPRG